MFFRYSFEKFSARIKNVLFASFITPSQVIKICDISVERIQYLEGILKLNEEMISILDINLSAG